ncbi:MAG TPA: DUF465 domain-containing protein [Thermohalobaculum sp.]|nr:DUF465 domain-containing protein [Thermohalobaculum sp.]
MSHVPHELPEAFPDKIDVMHELRASDAHFSRLSDQYHVINREIHRAETDVEPMSDFYLEDMKKRRLALLDEIAAIINRA